MKADEARKLATELEENHRILGLPDDLETGFTLAASALRELADWSEKCESGLSEFALAIAEAAGFHGTVTGEEVVRRVAELRERERVLIDLAHDVLAQIEAEVDPSEEEAMKLKRRLDAVRLWWYPVRPQESNNAS